MYFEGYFQKQSENHERNLVQNCNTLKRNKMIDTAKISICQTAIHQNSRWKETTSPIMHMTDSWSTRQVYEMWFYENSNTDMVVMRNEQR